MGSFEKIELHAKSEIEKDDTMARRKRRTGKSLSKLKINRQKLGVTLGVVLVVLLLGFFFVVIPAKNAYTSAQQTMAQARLVADAVKTQNIAQASDELKKTQESLTETQKHMGRLAFFKLVPLVNWYYNDADHALKAGEYGLQSATMVVESLKPYADVLGLKGEGSATGSTEERIKTAVLTMGKITPQIDSISESLNKVEDEVSQINPDHYPEFLFGKDIKSQLTQLRETTIGANMFVEQAKPLIKVLPSLLGESEEKKYLVLFQNDKELRPTGGFLTSYSIFKLDKGVISVDRQDDIYPLDDAIPNKPPAPAPILKYLPNEPRLNLRNSNLSPDFVKSMETFYSLYQKSPSADQDIDGIIALDTHVLVSTIRILDDQVTASGITFTTKEDARCKCPQVIYELEDNISRPVNYIRTDRKGLIGSLMRSIMDKALTSSPKEYWGPLFQSMLMQVNQKHVMFYLFDKEAQSGIQALNAAGQIRPFEGDYLHINNANLGGQKSNLFTTQSVDEVYEVADDGTITKTITLEYQNEFPPSDCNLERGGLCLNAELRNWLRIYVPQGSKLVDSKGSEVKMTTYDELGKTVFDGFLTVRPLGKKTFTISYTLPFKLDDGSSLPVMIQKQPGTDGTPYTITVNGKKQDEFSLFADKEFSLKL